MSEAQPSSNPLADILFRSGQAGQILELFKSNLGNITDRAAASVLPGLASSLVSQIADAAIDRLKEKPLAIIARVIEARKPAPVNGAYAKPVVAPTIPSSILPPRRPVDNDSSFLVLLRTNSITGFIHLKAECERPIYLRMEPDEFRGLWNYVKERHPEINLTNLHRQTRAVRHFAQPPVVAKIKPVQAPIPREAPVAAAAKPTGKPFGLFSDARKPSLKEARPITERKKHAKANGIALNGVATKGTALVPVAHQAVNVQPVIRREATALEQEMEREIPRLRRYARSLTRDIVIADDLVQDTLQRGLAKIHLWQQGTDLRAWLFTIMHNQYVNHVRKAVREGQTVSLETADSIMTTTGNQMDKMRLRDLANGLAKLPEEQRLVILFIGLEGNSYEQAAEHFGIPVGTVRSRLSRGREALRDLMEDDTGRNAPSDNTARRDIHRQLLLLTARS